MLSPGQISGAAAVEADTQTNKVGDTAGNSKEFTDSSKFKYLAQGIALSFAPWWILMKTWGCDPYVMQDMHALFCVICMALCLALTFFQCDLAVRSVSPKRSFSQQYGDGVATCGVAQPHPLGLRGCSWSRHTQRRARGWLVHSSWPCARDPAVHILMGRQLCCLEIFVWFVWVCNYKAANKKTCVTKETLLILLWSCMSCTDENLVFQPILRRAGVGCIGLIRTVRGNPSCLGRAWVQGRCTGCPVRRRPRHIKQSWILQLAQSSVENATQLFLPLISLYNVHSHHLQFSLF